MTNVNSDHAQRVVVDACEVYHGQGAQQLLEATTGSFSQISIEHHDAGSTWSYSSQHLVEILVVRGLLGLEAHELPANTYLRLAPGTAVTFMTSQGCVLYVNQREAAEPGEESFVLDGSQLTWHPGMVPGLKVTSLHQGSTKHTALVRWAPDTRFNPHTHVGGEEILVLNGIFRDEHGEYPEGTWIRSPHLSNHKPYTDSEGATILVKVGHLNVT